MNQIKKFVRTYMDYDKEGKEKPFDVTYTLFVNNGVINDIRNEYGFSIEKNSECWDFITNSFVG